jgi:hypothetical protein
MVTIHVPIHELQALALGNLGWRLFALNPVSPLIQPPLTNHGEKGKKGMNIHKYLKLNLKRHPRSSNSADVLVGFRKLTRPNITTFVLNCNTKRHQINIEIALTIEFWLLVVGCSSTFLETSLIPRAGEMKFTSGPLDA